MGEAEAAELLRMLAKIEDVQASFQIMRLSVSPRLPFFVLHSSADIYYPRAEDFDALLSKVMASMIAGEGVAKVGLASPEKMAVDLEECKRQMLLGPEALSQARLAIRWGEVDLASTQIYGEQPTCDDKL